MAVINIAPVLIQAGGLRESAPRTPGANFKGAIITMVDPNTQWPAAPDNTRHVKIWGLRSSEDGVTWKWGPVYQGSIPDLDFPGQPEDPTRWLAFGSRGKNGGMPSLRIDASQLIGSGTTQLRLGIVTDANITLGANIQTL